MIREKTFAVTVAIITGIAGLVFAAAAADAVFLSSEETTMTAQDELAYVETNTNHRNRNSQASIQTEKQELSIPSRLSIPAIGVDAHVEHVGISSRGNMAVPYSYSNVGWYRNGTIPGELGSAVIAGHVDNGISLAAVFYRLENLSKGDRVFVTTVEGKILEFVVTSIASYHYKNVPLDLVFNQTDKARLNLITCDGRWLSDESTYDRRLIVYTELADE